MLCEKYSFYGYPVSNPTESMICINIIVLSKDCLTLISDLNVKIK